VALTHEVLTFLTGRHPRHGGRGATAAPPVDTPTHQHAAGGEGRGISSNNESEVQTQLAACIGAADELLKELEAFSRQTLDGWQAATAGWLAGVAGWKGARLMSFDAASRHVNASFSESLVSLLREVGWLLY